MVELSFINTSFNISNNVVAVADYFKNPFCLLWNIKDIQQDPNFVWQDPVVINIDNFLSGFSLGFGMAIKPFSLNFNWKDKWGFGLDIAHIDATGNMSLSGKMMNLQETKNDQFGAGAAVFAEVGIPVFFHVNDFKIKIRPAVYIPLVYTEPNVRYSYKQSIDPDTGIEGMKLELVCDINVYTIIPMNGIADGNMQPDQYLLDNYWNILRNNTGYDFGLNIEYPWDSWLDIGVDVVNIPVPFLEAKLNHSVRLEGEAYFDSSKIDIYEMSSGGEIPEGTYGYPEDFEIKYGSNSNKKIYRPFTMLFYANYRPRESPVFSLIPALGFSINRLYVQTAAVEGGLSARWDHGNIFITTIGVNYNDRKWKNSLDFVLNLRAFEFDFGLSLQSQNFKNSWKGAGLGINTGVKLGW
jgi:hypothetical protein